MNHPGFESRARRRVLGSTALLAALFAGSAIAEPTTQTPGVKTQTHENVRPYTFVWKGAGVGYLGVQILGLTPELRRHFGAPEEAGVMISKVEENGPAAAAGLIVGDILTQVDGKPVSDPLELVHAVRQKKAGDTAELELYRDGARVEVTVSLEERDRQVIDLSGMRFPPKGEGFVFLGPGLDQESVDAFEKAMRGIEDRLQSKEWREKLEKFREMDLSKIQERMKEVEERLKKLEDELQQEGLDKKKLDD